WSALRLQQRGRDGEEPLLYAKHAVHDHRESAWQRIREPRGYCRACRSGQPRQHPVQAKLDVKSFNPVKAGVLPASEGISMDADVQAQVHSDGKTLTSAGKIHALHLQLSPAGSPAPQPVDISYNISDDLNAQAGRITDITAQAGSA